MLVVHFLCKKYIINQLLTNSLRRERNERDTDNIYRYVCILYAIDSRDQCVGSFMRVSFFRNTFCTYVFFKKKKRFHSGVHTSTLRIHVEKIKRKGRREEENKKIEREIKKKRKKFIVIVYIVQFQKWNARSRATWKVCYRKFRISSRFTDLSASGN